MFFKKAKEEAPVKQQRHLYLIDYENTHEDGLYGLDILEENNEVIIFFGSLDKTVSLKSHKMILSTKATVIEMQMEKTTKNYLDFQLSTYCGYLIGKGDYLDVTIISKDAGFDSIVNFWIKNGIKIKREVSIVPIPVVKMPEIKKDKDVKPAVQKQQKVKEVKAEQVKNKSKKEIAQKKEQPVNAQKKNDSKLEEQKPALKQPNKKVSDSSMPEEYKKKVRKAVASLKLSGQQYIIIYNSMKKSATKEAYQQRMLSAFGKSNEVFALTEAIYEEYRKSMN